MITEVISLVPKFELDAVAKISRAAMRAPTLDAKCMRDSEIGSVGRVISHGLTRDYHEQLPVSNTVHGILYIGVSVADKQLKSLIIILSARLGGSAFLWCQTIWASRARELVGGPRT